MKVFAFLTALFLNFNSPSIYDQIPSPIVRYHDSIPDALRQNTFNLTRFREFCVFKPDSVLCSGNSISSGVDLPFSVVYKIDVELRGRFIYNDDWSLYHTDDLWQNWVISGDCEDYALTLSELMSKFGQSGADMRLVLLKITSIFGSGGHAMLAVRTSDKGWVLIGVNDGERPVPGTKIDFLLPDSRYHAMVEIPMDGTRRVLPLPGYTIKSEIIFDKT